MESTIPHMGGRKIASFLYETARNLQGLGDVVECGSWLGASIAPVAMGLRDSGSRATIHCYDVWRANESEAQKATLQGRAVSVGQDLLPIFENYVRPIYPRLVTHQGLTIHANWQGGPVELYIDDCNKDRDEFEHVLATWGPAWIAGSTIVVLMDFALYTKFEPTNPNHERLSFQQRFVHEHPECFELVAEKIGKTSTAAFRFQRPW